MSATSWFCQPPTTIMLWFGTNRRWKNRMFTNSSAHSVSMATWHPSPWQPTNSESLLCFISCQWCSVHWFCSKPSIFNTALPCQWCVKMVYREHNTVPNVPASVPIVSHLAQQSSLHAEIWGRRKWMILANVLPCSILPVSCRCCRRCFWLTRVNVLQKH